MFFVLQPQQTDYLLQKVSESESLTAEDQFVNNIIQKAQTAINDLDPESVNNPMTAVSGLMKSGILTDMIVGLQNQVGTPRELIGSFGRLYFNSQHFSDLLVSKLNRTAGALLVRSARCI